MPIKIPKEIIVIIPARGGSKRLPNKNILPLGGLPLVAHSIIQARRAKYVSRVYVSTNDPAIAAIATQYGAYVIDRPIDLASDAASSESALAHVLSHLQQTEKYTPDLVVFLQCTSPLRRTTDIDQAIETLVDQSADSLFSVCRDKGLLWWAHDQNLESINYDYHNRKREQEMGVQYRENGSMYIFKPAVLERYHNRLGGKIVTYEMGLFYSFQIDSHEDLQLIEMIYPLVKAGTYDGWPARVSLLVFDFDGVFTDNTVKTFADGTEQYIINTKYDSLGLDNLRTAGIPAMVVTREKNQVVAKRCEKLKLPCHQGVDDKKAFLQEYFERQSIKPQEVIYVGNDINDLPAFELVGFSVAVADSNPTVILAADHILSKRGGEGAVREICDLIVKKYGQQ